MDLIFVKAKKKGERRINYARFLDALGMIAMQKYGDMVRPSRILDTTVAKRESLTPLAFSNHSLQPLEASVPRVLESHIAQLPCIVEFTDGKVVRALPHHSERFA